MRHDHLFDFESEFVSTLRCVPMAVRFKLDRIGIKLTLRQWSTLTVADRDNLLRRPCHTLQDQDGYRAALQALVLERSGTQPKPLPEPPGSAWESLDGPPPAVAAFARGTAIPAVAWRGLAELQRFALVKLSRDNHDNVNFRPALREFGLLTPDAEPLR